MDYMGLLLLALAAIPVIIFYAIIFSPEARAKDKLNTLLPTSFVRTYTYTTFPGDAIVFDAQNRRIAVYNQYGLSVFNYDDVLEVELYLDNSILQSTKSGSLVARAAIGAVVAGPLGAIVGGVTAKSHQEARIDTIIIQVITTNTVRSHQSIAFLRRTGSPLSARAVEMFMAQSQECYGRLRQIALLNSRGHILEGSKLINRNRQA